MIAGCREHGLSDQIYVLTERRQPRIHILDLGFLPATRRGNVSHLPAVH